MSHQSWSDEHAHEHAAPSLAATSDRLGSQRWLGRVAGLAFGLGRSRQAAPTVTRPALNIAPEHLVVIVLVSSQRVSATVAALHPEHGDKVVAHKAIDCVWHRLTQSGKREAVSDAVRLACDSAGVEAYSIYLSMTEPTVASRIAVGWADPGGEMLLSEHECEWALKRARDQATSADNELVEVLPVHWMVRDRDGEREVEDPVGQRGSRLTCQALLVTARRGYRDELAALVEGLGIEVEGVIAHPVALYRGMASSLPKKGHAVIIDHGARTTTVLVRHRDKLVHIETHAFGGEHLTRALVERLGITPAQAEDLKHDLDITARVDARDSIVGQQFIWSDLRERHRMLGPATTVITEALGTFFRARAQELRDAGFLGQQGQVHLVGRASSLSGLVSFLRDVMGLPVVLGTGQKNRDPSAELADVIVSGLVCTAADMRRRRLLSQESRIRKTASGVWSWLAHPLS